MRLLTPLALSILLLSCSDSSGPNGNNTPSLDLAGSWTGTLSIVTTGGTFNAQAALTLTHTGSSVAGSMVFDGDTPDALAVTGTVSGSVLTITMTPSQSPSDDCHLFSVTLTFDASETALSATGGSGQVCDGDGMGGHEPLDTLTGLSGTLTR